MSHIFISPQPIRIFAKNTLLPPSEMFLILSLKSWDAVQALVALRKVLESIGKDVLVRRESPGISKIALSLGKEVLVVLPDISPQPLNAFLESATPAIDGDQHSGAWVIEISRDSINRQITGPLPVISSFFTEK